MVRIGLNRWKNRAFTAVHRTVEPRARCPNCHDLYDGSDAGLQNRFMVADER